MHVSTDSHLTDDGSSTCLTFLCISCWKNCYITRLNFNRICRWCLFCLYTVQDNQCPYLPIRHKVKSVSNEEYLDKNIVQLLQLYPKTIMASSHDSCPICSKSYNLTVVISLYKAFSFRYSQRASLMPAAVQLTILLFPRKEVLAEPVSELT